MYGIVFLFLFFYPFDSPPWWSTIWDNTLTLNVRHIYHCFVNLCQQNPVISVEFHMKTYISDKNCKFSKQQHIYAFWTCMLLLIWAFTFQHYASFFNVSLIWLHYVCFDTWWFGCYSNETHPLTFSWLCEVDFTALSLLQSCVTDTSSWCCIELRLQASWVTAEPPPQKWDQGLRTTQHNLITPWDMLLPSQTCPLNLCVVF